MIRRSAFAVFLIALAPPAASLASQQGVTVMKSWANADKCAQAAQKAYPDYTAEALAKRDYILQLCLTSQNQPGRAPVLPPGAKP